MMMDLGINIWKKHSFLNKILKNENDYKNITSDKIYQNQIIVYKNK